MGELHLIPDTTCNLVIVGRSYVVLDSSERELDKVMKTESSFPHSLWSWWLPACDPLLTSLFPAALQLPSLHPLSGPPPTPTSVASIVIYLVITSDLCVSPSEIISPLHRGIQWEGPTFQRFRAGNKPDILLPRPAAPSPLSPWVAPSFCRLHTWKPGCGPQLLPPVGCLQNMTGGCLSSLRPLGLLGSGISR